MLGLLFGLSVLAVGLLRQDMERVLMQPIDVETPVLFEIAKGQGISAVAAALSGHGFLERPFYLRLEAMRLRLAGRLQAGVYELGSGLTPRELLQRFVRGDVKRYRFTVVEGSTFKSLRTQIAALPGVTRTVTGLSDEALMQRLDAGEEAAEGRFFPSTYEYLHHTEDLTLYRRAHAEMRRVLAAAWTARQADLPYRSPEEALIMASVIEKETGLASERAAIARVFVRRLQRGMRLQTDPTVIYGLGEDFDGNLRKGDLLRDTPFNTYTRAGLPPTPIALPGEAAIVAALNPAPGEALYFVARGDGSHEFSATLVAHQRAVRRYQSQ
ncbi:MAG: endolytic transglycosylase MltG [Gammaproteobacteria bacterium]|nr:endolytic transglycosylase MltG [Gammaproteobacteria bacterium]